MNEQSESSQQSSVDQSVDEQKSPAQINLERLEKARGKRIFYAHCAKEDPQNEEYKQHMFKKLKKKERKLKRMQKQLGVQENIVEQQAEQTVVKKQKRKSKKNAVVEP